MELNGGMGWPVRYTPPVVDMQDMQTPPSDTKGHPQERARCALPICKMPQILVITTLASWVLLSNCVQRCWHPGCGSTMTLPDRISATRNIIASFWPRALLVAFLGDHRIGALRYYNVLSGRISDCVCNCTCGVGTANSDSAPCLLTHRV